MKKIFLAVNFLNGENFFTRAINFFREDVGEVVGAYFDGVKIFVVRLTESFETVEVDAESSELEHLAEKISLVCRQRGWQTSAVGVCLREDDAVIYQTEINFPGKEIASFVKSWSQAQAGIDAAFSFVISGGEIWMETLPKSTLDDYCAAFEKFGLKLRALSIMPVDLLTKVTPFNHADFIAQVVHEKKSPNLLSARSSVVDWKKISQALAAMILAVIIGFSAKILFEYQAAAAELDAAKKSLDELRAELALKENIDADIAELNRLNKIVAAQEVSPTKFNFLVNLGKVAGGGVHLSRIRCEENFLELEGVADNSDAVKNYLSRVKNSVAQNSRLENSTELDDGNISFVIRAAFK